MASKKTKFGAPIVPPNPLTGLNPLVDPNVRALSVRPAPVPESDQFGAPVDPRMSNAPRPVPTPVAEPSFGGPVDPTQLRISGAAWNPLPHARASEGAFGNPLALPGDEFGAVVRENRWGVPLDPSGIPALPPPRATAAPTAAEATFGAELNPGSLPLRATAAPATEITFGAELNPSGLPGSPPPVALPTPTFSDVPVSAPLPQARITNPIMLTPGLNVLDAPPGLPAGFMPSAQNFAIRNGGLEPRFGLAVVGGSALTNSSATLLGRDAVVGLTEYSSSTGARNPVAISTRSLAYFTASWNSSVYTGSYSMTGDNTNLVDAALVYDPTLNEYGIAFTNSKDSVFWWDGPSSASAGRFSTLTNAPRAAYVANFDSRVVAGNITSNVGSLPQRVAWSDRALPQTWAAPGGGTVDLLDATGRIQRLLEDGDRLIVFFDFEIWAGFKADYPFGLQFLPVDRTVGLSAPFSAAKTPRGIIFLGHDLNIYLLPKGGTPQPIGTTVWPKLRDEIVSPELSVGAYDSRTFEYHLAYPIASNTGPQRVLRYNVLEDRFTMDVHVSQIRRLEMIQFASGGTQFGQLVGTFTAQGAMTYAQLGAATARTLFAGTSDGTVGQFVRSATSDLGIATDCRALTMLGNPNPTERQYLKELWIDYYAASASSVTINLSDDFGQTFQQYLGVALPATNPSGQTIVAMGYSATYPSIQFQHDLGQQFRIQRVTAVTEESGRGGK